MHAGMIERFRENSRIDQNEKEYKKMKMRGVKRIEIRLSSMVVVRRRSESPDPDTLPPGPMAESERMDAVWDDRWEQRARIRQTVSIASIWIYRLGAVGFDHDS